MHTKPMAESDGKFVQEGKKPVRECPRCGNFSVYHKSWESSCGGYEDSKYKCAECHYSWWVDGLDA